jgi:signal transduction histidine kinase
MHRFILKMRERFDLFFQSPCIIFTCTILYFGFAYFVIDVIFRIGYYKKVRKAEFPYLADWFAISLRWFILLGLTIALTANGDFRWPVVAILMLSAIWNIGMSLMAMFNRRLPAHRVINVSVDGLTFVLLFGFSGGISGSISWVALLTLASAAIYYEFRGSMLLSLILSIWQIGWTLLAQTNIALYWMPLIFLTIFTLSMGAILGLGSLKLMDRLRDNYKSQLNRRREIENNAKKQERSRVQTFYQLIETLSSTLNYKFILDSVLDLSQTALTGPVDSAEKMTSAMMMFSERDLIVVNSRRFSPSDLKLTFPGTAGVLYETISHAEYRLINDIKNDPELGKVSAFLRCNSAIALPLSRGLDSFGVMIFGHHDENFFDSEKVELLQMISRQAVIAIQNAELYQQLQQEKENIIETQEEARNKLARDLHDGPTQSIASIAMRLNISRKMLEVAPQDVEAELERIEELARRTTTEIRHMLFTMRPLILESEGLAAALDAIAEKTITTYQQKVRVEIKGDVISRLDPAKQTVIFYLVEEAVNNARKHAQAPIIVVRMQILSDDQEIALLEIIDNGVGFNIQEVEGNYNHRGSLGMVNLRERTQLVNGLLHLQSVPGRGTRVQVYMPLSQEAIDRLQHGEVTIKHP